MLLPGPFSSGFRENDCFLFRVGLREVLPSVVFLGDFAFLSPIRMTMGSSVEISDAHMSVSSPVRRISKALPQVRSFCHS